MKDKIPFSKKFFLIMFITVIIPMSVGSLALKTSMEHYVYDDVVKETKIISKRCQDEFVLLSEKMSDVGMTFMQDTSFLSLLSKSENKYEINKKFDELVFNVNNLIVFNNYKANYTFVDKNKNVYSSWDNNTALSNNQEFYSWVAQSKSNLGIFRWDFLREDFTYNSVYGHALCLSFSLYNHNKVNEYLGTMILTVPEECIRTIIEEYGLIEDNYCIADSKGKIIIKNQELEVTDRNIADIQNSLDDILKMKLSGEKYHINIIPMPLEWTNNQNILSLILFTPEKAMTEKFSQYTLILNMILIVGLILIIIESYFIIRYMVKPLSVLANQMIHYEGKSGAICVDIERKDEIGDLNRAFVKMSENIERLIKKVEMETEFKEKYHYEALMAQLTPHFLFNTLNLIRWMAIISQADNIVQCVDSLANLLEYSMNKEGEIVELQEEIAQIKSYLNIYSFRYGDKISLNIEIEESLLKINVLKFMLQPIVENSIKHGFKDMESNGIIKISGSVSNSKIFITVADNGNGISKERIQEILEKKGEKDPPNYLSGIGIHHVNTRIKYLYGDSYGIALESEEKQYTKVIFTLPLQEEKNKI